MNLLIVTHQLPGIILVVFQTARISSQAVVAVFRLLKASEVSFWSDSSLSFKIKGKDDIAVRVFYLVTSALRGATTTDSLWKASSWCLSSAAVSCGGQWRAPLRLWRATGRWGGIVVLLSLHAPALPASGCWWVAPDQGFRTLSRAAFLLTPSSKSLARKTRCCCP